ncbi:hypothetical protein [Providencia sneebia]|uniref:Lipoprotein n=1 Tax=Providencia sneebia DSM 19967 TaxID=1141660 RepID=K8WRM9_9GAMM|nr:hypothetical protein [Providencia sneebia]EKT60092.1 hypothetical protein OO7_04674 [Providencia sneebia DSM 19967]
MKIVKIIVIATILLVGCTTKDTSKKDGDFEFVYEEAKECVDVISNLLKGNKKPYTLSFAYYVTSHSIPVINGNFTQSEKKAIPYIIVPLKDKIQAGDEWRSCMREKKALVPNIQFPE